MSGFLNKFKNIIFGKKESQEIADSLTELNQVTSAYIRILDQQVQEKKEKIKKIRVLVQGSIPKEAFTSNSTLDISVIDAKNIKVRKGERSKMKWQDEMRKFTNQNKKGTIVSGFKPSSNSKGTMVSGTKGFKKNKGTLI